ncbi:MAG: hypothetical protein V4717_18625 [Bacteroidota bacterium]
MNRLSIYRFVSYLLLPIGTLLGLATLIALFVALGNMAMLLSLFLTGATVIYIFSSFVFLRKGIEKGIVSKKFLKDLIKVNAFVTLFFAIMGVMQGILVLLNPTATRLLIDNMLAMQPEGSPPLGADQLMQVMKGVLYFMIILGSLLLFHIGSTFRYLKQHAALFTEE